MTPKVSSQHELTPEQKKKVLELFKTDPNIETITQKVFDNKKLDGRCWQGKLVSKFLVEENLEYKTTKPDKKDTTRELTPEDKEYIISAIKNGDTIIDVTRVIFRNDSLQRQSYEWRKVQTFVSANNLTPTNEQDDVAIGEYQAPKEIKRLVDLVNNALGYEFSAEKIVSGKYKTWFDRLRINLDNSRVRRIINAYESRRDRTLFIDEFIRLTFEKPDLTPDELNLYIQIVRDNVSLEVLEAKINKLNGMFLDIEEAHELKQNFSENLKACVDEKNQITKRIADTTKKLQGDRSERLKNNSREDLSILTIVNLIQDQEEREKALQLAEMQRAAISEEANRFENLDSWICRVMGVSKEEVI